MEEVPTLPLGPDQLREVTRYVKNLTYNAR